MSGKKVPAIRVLEAMDTVDEFTKEDIATLSDASISGISLLLPKLIEKGLLTLIGHSPHRYRRDSGVSLVEAFEKGEIKGGHRQRSEPVEQQIEIDPIEVFESMDPDDFGKLVSLYVKKKNAVLEPLQERISFLTDNSAHLRSELGKTEAHHEQQIRSLREELRVERERVMELRTALSKEKESRAVQDAPVKTILIRGDSNSHAQSGGSGIPSGALSRVVVHRKGIMKHVPKGARRN